MKKILAPLALALVVLTGCNAPGMGNNGVGAEPEEVVSTTSTTSTTTTIPEPVIREYSQAEKEELFLARAFNVQWSAAQSEDVILRFGYAACHKFTEEGVYPGTWIYEPGGALEMLGLKRDKVMDLAYVIGVAQSTLCPATLASDPIVSLPPLPETSATSESR
jgi:hypothetical protein